ncbi:hypothetical protein pb186bvf_016033, partial [Paramecium bursaria]
MWNQKLKQDIIKKLSFDKEELSLNSDSDQFYTLTIKMNKHSILIYFTKLSVKNGATYFTFI